MRNVRIPLMLVLGLPGRVGNGSPTEVVADRDGDKKIAHDRRLRSGRSGVGSDRRLPAGQGRHVSPRVQPVPAVSALQQRGDPARARPRCSWSVTHRGATSHRISWSRRAREFEVKNEGGRPHTFTPVAEFGGGRVPPLLVGTQMAARVRGSPRRATDPYQVAPGARLKLKATRRRDPCGSMCCFHPWMRATVRVAPDEHHGHDKLNAEWLKR